MTETMFYKQVAQLRSDPTKLSDQEKQSLVEYCVRARLPVLKTMVTPLLDMGWLESCAYLYANEEHLYTAEQEWMLVQKKQKAPEASKAGRPRGSKELLRKEAHEFFKLSLTELGGFKARMSKEDLEKLIVFKDLFRKMQDALHHGINQMGTHQTFTGWTDKDDQVYRMMLDADKEASTR